MQQIIVQKGRTVIVPVSIGFDVSTDILTSEIRVNKNQSSELIATWTISFATNGIDGEIVLTLDNSITSTITKNVGYMDIKRVSSGEPLSIFDEPLEVAFVNSVTG